MTIGTRIRLAREAKGLSQEQLGRMVGPVTREAVSLWESDGTRPRDARLERIAEALGVEYAWLRADKGAMSVPQPDVSIPADLTENVTFDPALLRRLVIEAFSFDLQAEGAEGFSDKIIKAYLRVFQARRQRGAPTAAQP